MPEFNVDDSPDLTSQQNKKFSVDDLPDLKKKEEPKLKNTSSGSTSSNTKSSSVSQSSSVNPYYVDITDKSKSSNTVSKPTFTPIVDKPLFKKDINVKSASEEQKLINAKNKVNTKSGTQNTQQTNYNEIINAGIKGTPMDNTYMPLSKPIVEKQSQTLVKQATEQKKVQQQAKSDKHQNILAIMPELGQAKNKDEALGMMIKSDMKNHVDMWQQFDDNALLNKSEYELNDFLVSNGFKDKTREQYLKEQAQSNPKYAYEYEYNQIGSLFKAVKQRADDYDYVLKSKFGDNYMQEAKDHNPNILGDEDFNKYLSLREKENSLSTKANGLINDSRFKDVKKQQDYNVLAQQKSDIIAKEDKWYNFSDEWRYLKNKAAYAAGHVVKLVAEIPSIATSEDIGYDFTDKIADWGNRFSENLVNSVPVSSDLQNGFNYEVAKVDGYKVILDDNKNPIKIVDNNNFNVSQQVSNKIFNKYNYNKDDYDIHNEYSPRSLVDNGLNTMIDMGIMILGTKGAGMFGAGENIAKLVSMGIGYMQTKRDTFNDAIKKGLDPKDADILSNIVGIAAGTSSIINPMEFNIATGNGIMGLIKKEGFDAAKLALIREGKLSVKEYAKEFIKEATKNALKENIEEVGIENTVQGLSNNYFNNKISETDKIDGGLDTGLHWTDKQGIETLLVTAGTAILLTPLEINSQTKLNQQEALKTAFENPEQFEQIRKLQLQQGYITQEQYDNERKIYDDVSRVYNASKDEVSEKEQPYLLALLTKKYNLAYKIDSIKDDTVSKKYKDLLGMVNASIDKVMKGEKPDNTIVETDDKTTEQDNTQQNTTYGSATATYNSSISTKIDVEIANKINQHGLESLTNNEKDYYENDKENIDKLIAGIKVNGGNKNTTQTNTGSDNLVNTESNVQTTNDNNTSQSEQIKSDNTISETTSNTQNTALTNEDKKSIISNLDKAQIKEFMALKTNTERNQFLLNIKQNEQSNKSTSTASANTESGQDNGTTVQTASTNDTGLGAGNEQSVPTNTKEIQQNDKGLQEKIDNLKNVISELENSPNSPFHKLVNLDEQKAKLAELEKQLNSKTTISEQITETTPNVEDKKADIERRKQEDTSVERGVLINYESGKTKEQLLDIVDKLKSGNITYDEVVKEFFNLPTNTLEEIKKYFNDGTLSDKIQFGLDVKEISDSTPKKKNKEEILKQKQIALSEKQKAEDALKNSEFKIVKKKDTITGQITETKIKRNVEEKTKYEDFYKQQINVANEQIKKADAELKSLENTKEKLISIQQKPTKQVEYSVGYNPQETETTPNVEDKQQAIGGDWSKDVESTAKALEDVDNNFENINKIVDVIINTASKEEKERIKKISDRKIPKGDKHWNEKNFKSYEEAKAFADNKEKEGATIFSLTAKEQPFLTKEEMDRKGYTVEYHYNPFIEKAISEAYHKAKADGSNPELVKAVEDLLAPKVAPTTNTEGETQTTEAQLQEFGVPEQDVKPVTNVLTAMVDGLRKAGLIAAKTVGEWLQIGKGEEKPYTLKINGEEKTVKPVNAEVVNGFYSPLEMVITESKQDKMPAKQWLDKFAKGEEAKWTGLQEWLSQQQGSVSKADIQKFLKENRVQIVEVVKGEDLPNYYLDKEPPSELGATRVDLLGDLSRAGNLDNPRFRDYLNNKYGRKGNKIYDWLVENSKVQGKYSKDTKFSQYQLAGYKEGYKEVLVTMPNNSKYQNELNRLSKKYNAEPNYKSLRESEATDSELEFLRGLKTEDFKSSHFDEPNILVHLRMNTRTDAEGNKVLFLEEVQSDWGQKGKKEGFLLTEKEAGKAWEEADKKYADFMNRMEKKYGSEWESELTKDEVNEEGKLLDARENTKGGNVPQSPFVTDTNAWTKLGLKVALKEAVAQGIDKIAWTTGEQQNDRYDLSKQVDEIGWQKNENGTYNITPKKDGSVIGTREMMANLTIKQIEDYVGKDIAEKIQNEEGKVWDGGSVKQGKLTGQQLKVGGKGMKGFYGEPSEGKEGIVGGVAKALVKELTGKPAEIVETKVKLADKLASGYDVTIKDENGRVTTHNFDTKSQGLAWLSKQKNIEVISEKAEGIETSTQHSIEITPELKAAVEKGQPLFKEAEAQYRIESGKNIIEAIKDFDGSPRATVALTHEIMHPTVVSIIDGAKEGNEVGAKHTKTIVDEYNKATGKNITQEQLIEGNDKFKEGTTTKEYRAVQEFIAKAWERYHREGGKGFSEGFQKVLDQITKAFQSVYKSLTGEQLTPELRKMFDDILGKEELSTDETTPTKEVSTSENKIKSWIDKWEELKKENDNEQLDLFYNKVKVALNGYAQGKGVVDEFTKLKSEIEQFAKERKAKPKEQGISLKDAIIDFGNGNTVSFDELNNNSENETEQIKSKAIADGNNDIRFQAEEPTDKGILDDLKTLKDKDLSDTEIRDVLDFMGYSKQDIDIALGGKEVFGIKKALVPEQVIENVNIDKLTHKQIFDIGKNNVDNNAIDPKQIVDDVLDGNITVLDANQVGSLIYYRAQLANRITELSNKIKEVEPNTGEYNVLKKQYDLALQEQDNYHEMAVRTAYNQSIAFSMRKLLIDDEYTAQKQISIYKQVNNGTISAEKEQEFKELAQKYKEASDRIAELEQEKAKWNAQNEIELTIEKSKKISKQNSDRKKTGRDLVAQGLDELGQLLGGIKFASGDNMPQLTKALSKIGRGLIEIGSATVDDVFDKIKTTIKDKFGDKINIDSLKESVTSEIKNQYTKATVNKKGELSFSMGLIRSLILNGYNTVDTLTNKLKEIVKDQFPDISDRQIHDAITRYGNSENQSKDDIDKELYKLKRIMLLMSKVEDAQAGKRPLKTGVIRDEATDEERTLQKQLNELLKDIPLDDTENDKRLKTALESVKTRLRNQIKDLETQIEQGKSEAKKKGIEYDDEANGLVELRDALKKQLEDKYGKGGMSDEQRLKMSLNQVKKAIDNYEQRINNKDFTQKDKSTTPSSEELTQAKQRLNSLKAEYTRMYKETKEYEAKQLENKKKAVRKRIEELKTKIVNKDFTPAQKKASPFDDELGKLNNEKLRQMSAFQKEQELNRIENRTKLEKAKDAIIGILNIPRMLTTTIDMSAPFRQGIRLMAGHPIEFAKAFIQMHKLAFSQKAYDDFMDKFRSSDAFPIIKASGLSITDVTSIQKAREEQFWNNIISNVLENKTVNKYTFGIPKVADNYTFKASERAYSGFLDMLRINVFMSAVDVMQNNGITIENNKEAYKQLAYYVNSATGRGDMGGVGQDAQSFLNTFFFSAKFMKSLYDYTKSFARASTGIGNELPPEIRKMIVKDFISFFAVNTILVGLGQLAVRALGGDDERKLETDGRSSDFMKIVKGDTRYEFWSGFQPAVRTAIQYATGEQKSVTTGNITELGSNMFTPTRNDKIIDFFGNKLSPIASYAYKWGKGTQFGKPFDAKGDAKKLFIPMNIQNIAEEVSNNVKASKIIIDAILNNYGVSVQNFNNNDKKEVSKDDTKANKHRPNRFKRDKNTVEQK